MNTQYAIVYEKLEQQEGIFVFRPLGLLKGKLIKKNEQILFKTVDDELFPLTNDSYILNENVHFVVGNIISEEELKEPFNEEKKLDDIIDIYLETHLNYMYFGIYLKEFDQIKMAQVDLQMTYTNLFYETLYTEYPNEYQKLIDEQNKMYLKNTIGFLQYGKKTNLESHEIKEQIGFIKKKK